MTSIPLAYGAFVRDVGKFPELVQRNLLAEKAPGQQEKMFALLARPAVRAFVTFGTGPLRGIFRKPGVFGGDAIIVSGTSVYRLAPTGVATLQTGSVPGRDRVRMDGGNDTAGDSLVRIATGDGLYQLSGSTVAAEDFPEAAGPGAQDICFHRGFWLGIEVGTDKVYFQVPGDSTWDALSFASAEYQPDRAVAIRPRGDQIFIFGEATTEVWALTGEADPAIAPYGGLNFDFGCKARDSVANIGEAILWVDDKCSVRLSEGGEARIVSNHGLSEQIRQYMGEELRAWTFTVDQHEMYCLTLGEDQTWVYDLTTDLWSRFTSKGYPFWRAHLGVDVSGTIYALDALQGSGEVFRLDPDYTSDDGDEIERLFSGYVEMSEGRRGCPEVEMIASVGHVPRTGQGSAPLASLRYSDDQAQTFGPWKHAAMPATGKFSGRVRWRGLGQIKRPYGRVFQVRLTDPVVGRISDLRMR
jgi:hypothetical protein